MLQSGGQLVLADTTPPFANTYYAPSSGLNLTGYFASYDAIYKGQLWVSTVVDKLALAVARLPLKVYDRETRDELDNEYSQLLRNPNPQMSAKDFWIWTVSTRYIFGEAMWLKVRGRNGRPAELWPLHPVNVSVERKDDGALVYVYHLGVPSNPQFVIPQRDVVHFKSYNPNTILRGHSPLEPLRATLLNEDAARRASTAFWKNGARPAVALKTPKTLSPDAMTRLSANWAAIHGGVDNFAKAAVLEEGMEAQILNITAEDAQYFLTRQLNRDEVVARYDVPPPVVHILDRATFSNITEQMRSMYRDTMAPRLQLFEADMEFQLRPDFGVGFFSEFLMDEVLRGDFETRTAAYQQAINSAWMMPSEARKKENLPFVKGSDRLFINSAIVPIDGVLAEPPTPSPPRALDALWGRLGTCASLDDVDPHAITAGLNGEATLVRSVLDAARTEGVSITEFRARLRAALA